MVLRLYLCKYSSTLDCELRNHGLGGTGHYAKGVGRHAFIDFTKAKEQCFSGLDSNKIIMIC